MKIKSYKFSATIPTGQYANIQPEIELEGEINLADASGFALEHISDLFKKYSSLPLVEKDIKEIIKLKSFNEDLEVDFDRLNHIYTYNGKKLVSATEYRSRFYKEFDASGVAKNCEKSWGIPSETIEEIWKSNSTMTADFGSLIHLALENYFNRRKEGKIVFENRGIDPTIPKHPILKKIILDFEAMVDGEGEVLTEVLVTDIENKRCGMVDRLVILDKDKKVCLIQDYKVNVSSEEEKGSLKPAKPYDELPPNKLTKYQIQLSYYADILRKSGWEVKGLEVYVLENEWKFYPLDIVEIV